MDETNKNIEIMERYKDLPEDIQQALFSSATSDAILAIGKKNGLAIDKIGELVDETGLVMLGITSPSDYVKNLVSRLSVTQEKARAIAEEINQKVFQPVRESLKKIHGLAAEKPTPPPPAPPFVRGGAEEKPLPPYEGGREGLGVKKPLPKREDIVPPPKALPKPEIPEPLLIPPIFVKKFPEPIVSKPDIVPPAKEPLPQDSLAAKSALDKELNAPPSPRPQQYKEKDPYREIIE
ncbi:MAG: hypothetical protein Q8Q46_02080 [Candidatus Giovannonibacteria bacterium]|nr:hypothetical protein [Candidatus Giovannonibacteria bacterium]